MKNSTDITIILDRSGSMSSVATDTIGGFNRFLKDQKAVPGECSLSLIQFDDQYEAVYRGKAIQSADELTDQTFVPRGNTALLDAIGRTIEETGKRLKHLPEAERPIKVMMVILTDGYENASHKFNSHRIAQLIAQQRDVYKWDFIFLGANQDAIATAAKMNINPASALTYANNKMGNQAVYHSLAKMATSARGMAAAGMCVASAFDEEDRADQIKAAAS